MCNQETNNSGDDKVHPRAEKLLDAANGASEKVARLQIAFLAFCAYVLMIVFSTSDLNLLIGKGIKLPGVEVEIPIVGFYVVAPFALLLGHFHLLLQYHLLSRKLFTLDAAVLGQQGGSSTASYDQLHIFPFTYYLIGHIPPLIRMFIAVIVTTIVLVLPLLTMLVLHARFLAYQDESITETQWVAILMDVTLVATLWPMTMDEDANWLNYMSRIWPSLKAQWKRCLWVLCGLGILSWMLLDEYPAFLEGRRIVITMGGRVQTAGLIWLVLTAIALLVSHGRLWFTNKQHIVSPPGIHRLPLGILGFLTTVLLGIAGPLILAKGGEPAGNALLHTSDVDQVGRSISMVSFWLGKLHYLNLSERNLFDQLGPPEGALGLYSTDKSKAVDAMNALKGINLSGRSLRYANFNSAVLLKADLRNTDLQGALFRAARLEYANLLGANLQNAKLERASLSSVNLGYASLQGANLNGANLEQASLANANLQGATLNRAYLVAANLSQARLEGADLTYAQLYWASMTGASLQGALLDHASFQMANLSFALLQGVNLTKTDFAGAWLGGASLYFSPDPHRLIIGPIDARGMRWRPLTKAESRKLEEDASNWQWAGGNKQKTQFETAIGVSSQSDIQPPQISVCLNDEATELQCQQIVSYDGYRKLRHPILEQVACQTPKFFPLLLQKLAYGGTGEILYFGDDGFPPEQGLADRLKNMIQSKKIGDECPLLAMSMNETDRGALLSLAKQDRERNRRAPLPSR